MSTKKRKTKNEAMLITPGDPFDPLHQAAFWGLSVLLLLPPYFRGLFFAPDQVKALLLAIVIFWLAYIWRQQRGSYAFFKGPLDYLAAALPLLYILSSFTAVNKGLALDAVALNLLLFLTYWSVSGLIRHRRDLEALLAVVYVSALGVALAGLAAVSGLVDVIGGFEGGRICSTLQYPNTLASYLGAVFLLGLYLWSRRCVAAKGMESAPQPAGLPLWRQWLGSGAVQSYLYAAANFILLAAFFGTKSRGGFLVFGFVFLFYLAGLGARSRLAAALFTAFSGAIAYLCVHQYIDLALNQHMGTARLWIAAGLALVLLGQFAFLRLSRYLAEGAAWDGRKYNLVFGSLGGLTALAAAFLLQSRADLWLKITNFEYLRSAIARFDFVADAIKMMGERPLLGWGGGGWREAYHSFQEYHYTSNEVHSHYFQVGVETGLPGMLVTLGMLAVFGYYLLRRFRQRKADPEGFALAWMLGAAGLLLAGHALIDFDFSLAATALLMWTMLAMMARLHEMAEPAGERAKIAVTGRRMVPIAAVSALCAVLLIAASLISYAYSQSIAAQHLFEQGEPHAGMICLQKAVVYNPWNADLRIYQSQILRAGSAYEESLVQALRAVELSTNNVEPRINLAEAHLALGQYAEAEAQMEKALQLSPLAQRQYDELAEKYYEAAYGALGDGLRDEGRLYLERAAQIPQRNAAAADALTQRQLTRWDGPPLAVSPTVLFAAGAALYQLGDFAGAAQHLESALAEGGDDLRGKALIWLALIADQQNQPARAEELLRQAEELLPEARESYDSLRQVEVFNPAP